MSLLRFLMISDASINKLYEAIADYEHLMHLTKLGGLPRNHPEYPSMKRSHLWALTQVKETKKIEKAIQFYKVIEKIDIANQLFGPLYHGLKLLQQRGHKL